MYYCLFSGNLCSFTLSFLFLLVLQGIQNHTVYGSQVHKINSHHLIQTISLPRWILGRLVFDIVNGWPTKLRSRFPHKIIKYCSKRDGMVCVGLAQQKEWLNQCYKLKKKSIIQDWIVKPSQKSSLVHNSVIFQRCIVFLMVLLFSHRVIRFDLGGLNFPVWWP